MYSQRSSVGYLVGSGYATAPLGTPSPFVQFSSVTMAEHQNTLERLSAQLEMIAQALADLEGEELRHSNEHTRQVETITREQDEIIRRAIQSRDMAEDIARQIQEEDARTVTEISGLAVRDGEIAGELRQLEDLEQEMMELEQSARDRLYITQNQIAMFSKALKDGLDVLETDAHEVRRIVTATHNTFSNDPLATSRAITRSPRPLSRSNDRDHAALMLRRSPIQVVSPTRREMPVSSSFSRPLSPRQSRTALTSLSDVPNLQSIAPTNAISDPGVSIPGSQDLLFACARVPMDPNEVTFLLRQNQSSVNALDQLDNSPLHIACMNPCPSVDAIHALLLAGANTNLKNAAGLTPFHLACLNHRGDGLADDHKSKRFLIFKGAQNPNQRTSRGETAAHLCAEDDKHFDALVFLVGAGVDAGAPAMLPGVDGTTRQMTAIDIARSGGARSAKNAEFLLAHYSSV